MSAETLSSIFAMTSTSSAGALGFCCDELAINTKLMQGFAPERKTSALLKTMAGSIGIMMLMIPAALAINAFIPGAIPLIMMVGGLYVATEGMRHLRGEYDDHGAEAERMNEEKKRFEKERLKKVLIIDGLLSVEITVMTLGVIAGVPTAAAAAVLASTGVIRTSWMYGVIGGVINMPRVGAWLTKKKGNGVLTKAEHKLGNAMLKATPYIMKGFSIAGTVALLTLGGGMVLHGIPGAEHLIGVALSSLSVNPLVLTLLGKGAAILAGLGIGAVMVPVLDHLGGHLSKTIKKIGGLFTRKPVSEPVECITSFDNSPVNSFAHFPDMKSALNTVAAPAKTSDNTESVRSETPLATKPQARRI